MTFIVPTNVVASRPSERQPTGMPHACANRENLEHWENLELKVFWDNE